MLFRLLLLFVIVPAVELALLIALFQKTDWRFGLGLILLTGILGSALAKIQGLKTWRSIQGDLASGRMPTDNVIHGLLILIAGALLLTPGMLTDAVGFCLLIPLTRALIAGRLKTWFTKKITVKAAGGFDQPDEAFKERADDDAITVDAEVIDHEQK